MKKITFLLPPSPPLLEIQLSVPKNTKESRELRKTLVLACYEYFVVNSSFF